MAPAAPVIGITSYRERASCGPWDQISDLLPATYAVQVEQVGGVPVLLPPVITSEAAISIISRLDGLLLAGGTGGRSPRHLSQDAPHALSERDVWEFELLDAANRAELPVLGISRGMQVMAQHAGGSLHEFVPDLVGTHKHQPPAPEYGKVEVTVVEDSRLARLVGRRLIAHCHHAQSVRTHPGFVVSARAHDGVLEAMELPGDRFVVGVQWHPETMADLGLLRGLIVAASRSRG